MDGSWMLVLLLLAIRLSCQETLATLTVSREKIRAGDSYNVTCRWDDPTVRPEHIKIQVARRGNLKSKRTPTATTVVDSVENALPGEWHYECLSNISTLESLYVPVGARLQVEDFECRMNLYDVTSMTNCSFSKPNGSQSDGDVSYYLSERGLPSVQCTDYPNNATRILCRIVPGALTDAKFQKRHNYTLVMSDHIGNQTQHFIRNRTQVLVPDWPRLTQDRNLSDLDNRKCLLWPNSVGPSNYADNGSIYWEVRVIPLNKAITEIESPPYYAHTWGVMSEQFCVDTPPYPNQQFELRLRRRFNESGAPWSEMITKEFWVPTTIPSRPPKILPNGFYLDPRSKGLYIFWEQLSPLEHNAPNLTYSLNTTDSKQASIVGRNFGIFPNWDDSSDSSISVCSENGVGRSLNCSDMYVPVLDEAEERQPTALEYDEATYTLSWKAPEKSSGLLHYTVYWCTPVNDTQKICDDSQASKIVVHEQDDASQTKHHFNRSMDLINLGVAATYQDKLDSGGMTWLRVGLPTVADLGKSRYLEGIVALIVLCLIFISYQKLHSCSDFEIVLPNGVNTGKEKPDKTAGAEDGDTYITKAPSQDPFETSSGIELVVLEHPKEHTTPIPELSTPLPVTVKPWIALAGTMPHIERVEEATKPIPDLSAMLPTDFRIVSKSSTLDYVTDDIITTPTTREPIQIGIETDSYIRTTHADGYVDMPSIISQKSRGSNSGTGYVEVQFNYG